MFLNSTILYNWVFYALTSISNKISPQQNMFYSLFLDASFNSLISYFVQVTAITMVIIQDSSINLIITAIYIYLLYIFSFILIVSEIILGVITYCFNDLSIIYSFLQS